MRRDGGEEVRAGIIIIHPFLTVIFFQFFSALIKFLSRLPYLTPSEEIGILVAKFIIF